MADSSGATDWRRGGRRREGGKKKKPCETCRAFTFPSHKPASFPSALSVCPAGLRAALSMPGSGMGMLPCCSSSWASCGPVRVSGSPLPIEYCLPKKAQGTDQSPDCVHPFLQSYFSTSSITLYRGDAGLGLLEINIRVVLDRGLGRAGVG